MTTRFSTLTASLFLLSSLAPQVSLAQGAAADLGGPQGTYVTIDSDPQGATFTLEGPNKVHYVTGTTPAAFVNLPTPNVIVHYANIEGCITPKPHNRTVNSNSVSNFFGQYDCEGLLTPPAPVEPVVEDMRGIASVRISPHQTENMPGSMVKYTVAVHNHSKTTQHDLSATVQFDPSIMDITDSLPANGSIAGPGLLSWNVPVLYAGQTWSVIVPLEIKEETAHGKRIEVNARISGDELVTGNADTASTRTRLSDTAVIGTPIMPPTGGRFDILFLLATLLIAFGTAIAHTRKNQLAKLRA